METRYEEASKVTILAILWNVFLSVIKVFAGVIGNSTAMIADGIHSASDIITSVGVLIGNKISSKPGDKEHNYGHEKAETLVSFLLSIMLIVVAVTIGVDGGKKIFNLDEVKVPTLIPLIVAVISIAIKEYQYRITIRVAKKINSPSLKADAWHHRSDALSSIAAFIGIGGAILGYKILEPIATIIVAIIVCKVALEIFINSMNELMDVSIDEEQEKQIIEYCKQIPGVKHIKTIRTRKHGAFAYVDLVICVDGSLTVKEGHDIATDLEKRLIDELAIIKGITVHVEPCINHMDLCNKDLEIADENMDEVPCNDCNSKECLNNDK
ncbi:cation diffusion facilitator family transporter [Intestinibacter sp.]|uniref:cation diffusion facilitator family transporter n=1 Tax=Intestinibacter sp. TaxID=1965304 RepID=UPI002A913419|nr:cation diffusion facilitator family transporter [Intestinibacter sp.]MDY5212315.1 cation diffusion facilitator family transporter [Intestinibacter sp.]